MMREEDKPFVMYRRGYGSFSIAPRNGKGVRQTIIWLALLAPIMGGFIWFMTGQPQGTSAHIGVALFVAAIAGWGIGGLLWMRARAEVVDLNELLKLKKERDRQRSG
jgi:hypothetical protein